MKNLYLCVIGSHGKVHDYAVGRYDEARESFYFSNGDLGANELRKEPRGSNATYVIQAISLDEIDDAGLFDSHENV